MQMQLQYDGLDTKRTGWLRRILVPWALMLAVTLVVCTALILDASMTPEQRLALFQHSGMYP
jgi:hypothetical protein